MKELGWLAYPTIFLAAAVEGEVVFVSACVLASMGQLNFFGVLLAGALGGSAGDQFYYYACRGGLRFWFAAFPAIAQRQARVTERVRSRAIPMMLACRFLPGLRIAIPVACAYADIPPARFTTCSLISGFLWALTILLAIVYVGPGVLAKFGVRGWWTPIVPGILVLGFFLWLSRDSRN